MLTLHYNGNTPWFKRRIKRKCNLTGEPLLHGKSTSKCLGDACEFRKPNYTAIRDIANVNLTLEWDKMVFAQTEHVDVPDNYHLIVFLVKNCIVDNVCQ